ncbi:MAG: alpha-amylase family glycosyl hydrolase [Spirochaetia bacterium]|nr:alpha-amylase family glycosyl hydrolase [Spirochaetota bacterium]MCX8097196.1 alpha-amylase family glycosyl hydrolase [Spirochaetota bacterium]MDW8112631.1 alpha-amylase family glycosyl hydrolase [Spirochaetia bacterium]
MFVYNLFPRIYGPFSKWIEDLDRIKELGVDWIYINPVSYPGFSGSLYSVKDHYKFNPLFVDKNSKESPENQFRNFIKECKIKGMKVMVDLILNHTAIDSVLIEKHKNWYKLREDGDVKRPGAWDNGIWVEWGDLAEIDNEGSPDKINLWNYWKDLVEWYIELGVDGFRCDYAYNVPTELWEFVIKSAKSKKPDVKFMAEILGGPFDKNVEVTKSGFDYVFSSAKWWNYTESWFVEQYPIFARYSSSVAFPESHDTPRISEEYEEDLMRIKQRFIFTAFINEGVMIPVGFEFGFKKKLDVVSTTPNDWEIPSYDISKFIRYVIDVKSKHQILREEGKSVEFVSIDDDVSMFIKRGKYTDQVAMFVVNRNTSRKVKRYIDFTQVMGYYDVIDVMYNIVVPRFYEVEIPRAGIKVFVNRIH